VGVQKAGAAHRSPSLQPPDASCWRAKKPPSESRTRRASPAVRGRRPEGAAARSSSPHARARARWRMCGCGCASRAERTKRESGDCEKRAGAHSALFPPPPTSSPLFDPSSRPAHPLHTPTLCTPTPTPFQASLTRSCTLTSGLRAPPGWPQPLVPGEGKQRSLNHSLAPRRAFLRTRAHAHTHTHTHTHTLAHTRIW
jgi:hypothetical protein